MYSGVPHMDLHTDWSELLENPKSQSRSVASGSSPCSIWLSNCTTHCPRQCRPQCPEVAIHNRPQSGCRSRSGPWGHEIVPFVCPMISKLGARHLCRVQGYEVGATAAAARLDVAVGDAQAVAVVDGDHQLLEKAPHDALLEPRMRHVVDDLTQVTCAAIETRARETHGAVRRWLRLRAQGKKGTSRTAVKCHRHSLQQRCVCCNMQHRCVILRARRERQHQKCTSVAYTSALRHACAWPTWQSYLTTTLFDNRKREKRAGAGKFVHSASRVPEGAASGNVCGSSAAYSARVRVLRVRVSSQGGDAPPLANSMTMARSVGVAYTSSNCTMCGWPAHRWKFSSCATGTGCHSVRRQSRIW